jgi:hypothetical protein
LNVKIRRRSQCIEGNQAHHQNDLFHKYLTVCMKDLSELKMNRKIIR